MGTATDRFWTILYPNAEPKVHKPSQIILEVDYNSYKKFMDKTADLIGIEIPRNFFTIRDREPERAIRLRFATRQIFQCLLANGYIIDDFQIDQSKSYYIARHVDKDLDT